VIYAVRDKAGTGPAFPDVDSNAKEAAAIRDLAAREIITGFSDGTFGGSSTVTRAQFAALLQRAFRLAPIYNSTNLRFSDVSDDNWFSKAVIAATKLKLLKGYDDGTFRPEATITRAEMAVVLARILAYTAPEFAPQTPGAVPRFDDAAEIPAWANDSIARMQQAGLLPEGGIFGPTVQVTRTECAYMLQQMLLKLNLI
jgi:2',3'-cyclic-nucleotide 2'-phosphodiesterase/3'-nucleotidase/5'-nucleotidase